MKDEATNPEVSREEARRRNIENRKRFLATIFVAFLFIFGMVTKALDMIDPGRAERKRVELRASMDSLASSMAAASMEVVAPIRALMDTTKISVSDSLKVK